MPDPNQSEVEAMKAQLAEMEANPTPAAPAPAAPLGVGARIADAVDSVNSGIGTGFHEVLKAGVHTVTGLMGQGEGLVNAVTGADSNISGELQQSYDAFDEHARAGDGSNYAPKTVAGDVAQPVSQFLTGFVMAGKVLQATGAMAGSGVVVRGVVQGMAADATAFNPNQSRLGNLVSDLMDAHPALRNPITEFMTTTAANPNDGEITGRLKNTLEGMMAGAVAGAVLDKVFAALKGARDVFRESSATKAQEKLVQTVKEIEAIPEHPAEGSPVAKEGVKPPEATLGTPEAPKPVDATANPEGKPLTADDTVTYDHNQQVAKKVDAENRAVKAIEQPLLDGPELDHLTEAIKNNPDWLTQGEVRPNRNFNYARLDSTDGAKLALDEVANVIRPKIAGELHQSFEETVRQAASLFDERPEALVLRLQDLNKSTKDLSATLMASRSMLTGLQERAADLARRVEKDPGLQGELDKVFQQTANVMSLYLPLRANTARATSGGIVRRVAEMTPAELKALQTCDPGQFWKILKPQPLWVRAWNAHNQVWINGLLSSAITHSRNVIGNALKSTLQPLERIAGGAATLDMHTIRQGAGLYLGLRSAFSDSLRLAVKASGLPEIAKAAFSKDGELLKTLKDTGHSILDPKNTKAGQGGLAVSTESFPALAGTKTGSVLDYFGQAANVPSRFLTAEDEFAKQINYRAAVHSDAYADGIKSGLKGDDLAQYIATRVEDSMSDAGAALNEEALAYAQRATFTTPLDPKGLVGGIDQLTHQHPYLKTVVPFVKTPTNILYDAVIRTPGVNLLSKQYRAALSGSLGTKAKADAIGQMMTGSALWGGAVMLAIEGNITGRGPADARERQALLATGWSPYSVKIGKKYISFQGFDPLALPYGLAGDFADAYPHMGEADQKSVVGQMLLAMATNITSKSYLTGISQVSEALTNPSQAGQRFLETRLASYVPSGFKAVANGTPGLEDPYMRETRGYMDSLMNRIPGFSQMLPPKRNVFGEAITARQAIGPDMISPFFYSEQKDDIAANELARLSKAISAPAQKMGAVDLTTYKNAKGQDFYDRWQEQLSTLKVGRYNLKERLEHFVTSDAYAKWRKNEPDALAVGAEPRTLKEVRSLIVEFREHALQKTLREYPEVAAALRAQKQAGVRADAGAAIPQQLQQLLNLNK